MKTQPKKRGRPVGSKKVLGGEPSYLTSGSFKVNKLSISVGDAPTQTWESEPDSEATVEQIKDWSRYDMSKTKYDTVKIEEHDESSMLNKITLVLTVVNVAILISLVIKNVWMK